MFRSTCQTDWRRSTRGHDVVALQRAARVITVSEASKRDIQRLFTVPTGKIEVIHNGIDERFGATPSDEEVSRVRERYQLSARFILYAATSGRTRTRATDRGVPPAPLRWPRARVACSSSVTRSRSTRSCAARSAIQAAQARAIPGFVPTGRWQCSTARHRSSSSRRCTRASGSHRSRRMASGTPSSRPTSRRSRRCWRRRRAHRSVRHRGHREGIRRC